MTRRTRTRKPAPPRPKGWSLEYEVLIRLPEGLPGAFALLKEIASDLCVSVGAVDAAIHRLRGRGFYVLEGRTKAARTAWIPSFAWTATKQAGELYLTGLKLKEAE